MGARFDVSGALNISASLALVPKKLDEIKRRSVVTLARRLPAEASRDIRETYNLPAQRVSKGLAVRVSSDFVDLIGSSAPIGLISYGAKQNKKTGVRVTVRKDRGQTLLKHAFIRSPGGRAAATGPQVFQREGGKGSPRYPIERLDSATIASILRDKDRAQRIADFGRNILSAEIDRQLRVLI